ncbi:MAG: hypothetical protein IT472_05700 [Thermomonas sp.]|uniref:hypothetical protein n=1 Tax=Thermomonas sp. TaxID=1971895 RepID=UPI002624FC3D|nr:hypothetical protein [Thermomonas sp.]MCC7096653.1 hypothetical protein [Thermomonas sp.]
MFSIRTSIVAACVAGLFALGATSQASAADRHVRIINKTSYTMVRFYASRSSTSDWEEDILGDSVVRSGGSVRINIDDGTGACLFDFKAVFSNGNEATRGKINVCEIGEYTYTD